jgi:hypothetical protein
MNTDKLSSASFKEILATALKLQDDVNALKRNLAEELLVEAKKVTINLMAEAKAKIVTLRDPAAADEVVCRLKEISRAALALEHVLAEQADSLEEQENLKNLLQ